MEAPGVIGAYKSKSAYKRVNYICITDGVGRTEEAVRNSWGKICRYYYGVVCTLMFCKCVVVVVVVVVIVVVVDYIDVGQNDQDLSSKCRTGYARTYRSTKSERNNKDSFVLLVV